MNINNLKIINNLTIKEFRDLAKSMNRLVDTSKEVIFNIFKENSKINPEEMFEFMTGNGLLEKGYLTQDNVQTWSAALPLRAIAAASLQKRKKSEKAWDEVAKALARTVVLSDSLGWNINTPSKLFLFGSLLSPNKADYGDADLALTHGKVDSYNKLKERQDKWLDNYYGFISSKCYNSTMGFLFESQLKIDIKSGNNFISIHPNDDIEYLSAEPENVGKFPVITLWENKKLKSTTEEKATLKLAKNWMNKNPEIYKEVQNRLNNALSNLGILPLIDPGFEDSCKEYIKSSLSEELSVKLPKLQKVGEDTNLIGRMVRMGGVGFEAIGRTLRDEPDFDIELSTLDGLLNSMDKESEKHYIKGFTETKSVKIKLK